MEIFTENWKHVPWSPCRFEDRDVHADAHKMVVVSAQKERPRDAIPDRVLAAQLFIEMLAPKEVHGSIPFMDLMLRVRQFGLHGEVPDDRLVLVDGLPFDAWQIWCVCVALLGCTDTVSWHLKRCEVGGELYLDGPNWRAVIKGCSDGSGPQILTTQAIGGDDHE